MVINKTSLNNFRADFEEAMKGLEEKYGVDIDLGNIRYDDDSFRSKIEVANKGVTENREKEQYLEFVKYNPNYGLTAEMWGKEVVGADGGKYVIVGVNPKARKNILVIEAKGERYSCRPAFIVKKA